MSKFVGVEIKTHVDVDVNQLADYLEDWFGDEELPCDGYYTIGDLDDEDYAQVLIELCKTVIGRYEKKE